MRRGAPLPPRRLYAEGTEVSVERSLAEVKVTLGRYGAQGFAFFEEPGRAAVAFKAHGRHVRFLLPLPTPEDPALADRHGRVQWRAGRPVKVVPQERVDAEVRRRWRALLLTIKSKLESVESGVESFEQAFLAQVVLPGGSTVGEVVAPRIEESYAGGATVPLLPEARP